MEIQPQLVLLQNPLKHRRPGPPALPGTRPLGHRARFWSAGYKGVTTENPRIKTPGAQLPTLPQLSLDALHSAKTLAAMAPDVQQLAKPLSGASAPALARSAALLCGAGLMALALRRWQFWPGRLAGVELRIYGCGGGFGLPVKASGKVERS